MNAIVIGAGVSGLTSAALLAKAGHKVTVYEQSGEIGGVTALARKNGFCWEQGPLLLGDLMPGERAYEILKSLGITLETERDDRGIVLPDYDMWHPEVYEGPCWRRERLKKLFPDEARGIDAYYNFYDHMVQLSDLGAQKHKSKNPLIPLKMALIYAKVKKYENWSAQQLMEHFFRSEKVRALFIGILADVCVAPSEFTALGVPFFNIETAFDKRIPLEENGRKVRNGYCYIKGGVNRIAEALADVVTKNGGTILTSRTVEKVLIEGNRARGVRLKGGTTETADIVIGSGGGREMFYDLVGREHLDEKYLHILETYRPMESVFMVHLGVDIDPLQYQKSALCYYYRTYDIEGAIKKLRAGVYHEGDEGFLIYVPSHHSPQMAPEGCHCVTIYTVAPDTLAQGSWEDRAEGYADKIIRLAEEYIPGLSSHIREKLIMTPVESRRLMYLKKSAFGGIVPIMGVQNPPHVTPVKGLYFVGQQSENAGGVSTVLIGAYSTYQTILSQSLGQN